MGCECQSVSCFSPLTCCLQYPLPFGSPNPSSCTGSLKTRCRDVVFSLINHFKVARRFIALLNLSAVLREGISTCNWKLELIAILEPNCYLKYPYSTWPNWHITNLWISKSKSLDMSQCRRYFNVKYSLNMSITKNEAEGALSIFMPDLPFAILIRIC